MTGEGSEERGLPYRHEGELRRPLLLYDGN
jgi:hypothetical protein